MTTEAWLRRLLSICSFIVFLVNFFLRRCLLRCWWIWNWTAQSFVDFFRCHFNIIQLYKLWQSAENNFTIPSRWKDEANFIFDKKTFWSSTHCGPAESTQGFSSSQRYFSFARFWKENFEFDQLETRKSFSSDSFSFVLLTLTRPNSKCNQSLSDFEGKFHEKLIWPTKPPRQWFSRSGGTPK